MLVDAETLLPARDGWSRVFGEATDRIKQELFESLVEITTPVVETAEEIEAELRALRHEVAERAAEHGLAVHRRRLSSDRDRAAAHRPCRAVSADEGGARPSPPPAERVRAPRPRLGARRSHVPSRVRGSRPASAAPARAVRELAVLGRRSRAAGARSAREILLEHADGRDAARAAQLGRLGGRDRRRQHAPSLGRVAAAGVRHARGARHGPADVGAADGRARGRGAAPRSRGGPGDSGAASRSTATEYARERERAGREGGGPEAERQLELGPEAALRGDRQS